MWGPEPHNSGGARGEGRREQCSVVGAAGLKFKRGAQ